MTDTGSHCPYCGAELAEDVTICPACHEDLSGLARLEYNSAIYYNQGLALAREGKLDRARDKLIVATELDETFAPAFTLLAKVYARQERWPEANAAIVRALQLTPDDAKVRDLAQEIDRAARAEQSQQRRDEQAATRVRRLHAERRFAAYQRDILGAFGLGMGIAATLALIISWVSGGGGDNDD